MAKGNMLQGMARGKVGDVVFSRLDGEQISRVRNRHPHNPRTNSQLYQRAIMATVMQAYSAGKEIFDHSFQGYAVGAANQRRFLSLNAKKLRDNIAADIAAGTEVAAQDGCVIGPGVKAPVPFLYQVSDGTLSNFLTDEDNALPAKIENETVAAYCARIGIVAEDILTWVGFMAKSNEEPLFVVNNQTSEKAKQFPCDFVAFRLEVKSSALTSNEAMNNAGQIFEVTKEINCKVTKLGDVGTEDPFVLDSLTDLSSNGTYGIIRSRKDSDLRSKCILRKEGTRYGLATQYALAAWQQGTVLVGDSDLILEGGDGGNVL